MSQPGYIALFHSGELKQRLERLEVRLSFCDICPRKCGVNRLACETGFCHSGYRPIVVTVCAHHGEEPVLSGNRGSGTIFFGNCNMRCVYCQNYQISQNWENQKINEVDCDILAKKMIYLQDELGCHNINFVSPMHFVPQIMRAVLVAIPLGLKIPLVYNTNGYDSVDTLKELDGIISIYLPDLRYANNQFAEEFSQVSYYVEQSREVIKEMYRQVGDLIIGKSGIAQQGLIVRHLVLPNGLAGSKDSLGWLAREISSKVSVSIMSQYLPLYLAQQIPVLARKISVAEYGEVMELVDKLGLENGWLQKMGSAENYAPNFEQENNPFSINADK
ncbi:MAG: radical SAM protein [Dehalococcoidales bacterium]|nr:radical SAM protein [Dehalococcoidales bacterium]